MITFGKHQLRAALTHAAKNEVRFYLNGVHLEFTQSGDIHIVSTDGNRMFCGLVFAQRARWTDAAMRGPFRLTVPYETVKAATKGKGDVTLRATDDGRYALGDVIFKPVAGVFPDWRRVIPSTSRESGLEQYNWAFVADACAAVQTWHDITGTVPVFKSYASGLMGGSGSIGVMQGPDCTAFCAVMTWETNACIDPFRPAAYELAQNAA
jgi:DNA polymerase-3 subunit beta